MGEYRAEALEEAKGAGSDFLKEIIDNIVSSEGQIRETSLDDYAEDYVREQNLSLKDAADLLDDLSDYEETDSGLWEGVEDPREAVKTMAYYTYQNAVKSFFHDLMESVNDKVNDAMGETLFFDFDEWLESKGKKTLQKGPFEWRPGVTVEEREQQEEALAKEHTGETYEHLEKLVKKAIEHL